MSSRRRRRRPGVPASEIADGTEVTEKIRSQEQRRERRTNGANRDHWLARAQHQKSASVRLRSSVPPVESFLRPLRSLYSLLPLNWSPSSAKSTLKLVSEP